MQFLNSVAGKMAGIVNTFVTGRGSNVNLPNDSILTGTDGDPDDSGQDQIVSYRGDLITAVYNGEDCTESILNLVKLNCPLTDKYFALPVIDILKANSESVEDLKHITSGLPIMVKYARHLIKDPSQRHGGWRIVNFNNQIFQKKIKPLKGFEGILERLGYTQKMANGVRYPDDNEPNKEYVTNIIGDMLLFRKEMKVFILGNHPFGQHIKEFLPQQTQDELYAWQVSGKFDEEDQDMSVCQASFIDLDITDATPGQGHDQSKDNNASGSNNSGSTATPTNVNNSNISTNYSAPDLFQSAQTAWSDERSDTPTNVFEGNEDQAPEMAISEKVKDLDGEEASDAVAFVSSETQNSAGGKFACAVCGNEATLFCLNCQNKPLCDPCNISWHKHPTRGSGHKQDKISALPSLPLESLSPQIDGVYGISALNRSDAQPTRLSKKQQAQVTNTNPADSFGMKTGTDNWMGTSSHQTQLQLQDYQQRHKLMYQMHQEQQQQQRQYMPQMSTSSSTDLASFPQQSQMSMYQGNGSMMYPEPSPRPQQLPNYIRHQMDDQQMRGSMVGQRGQFPNSYPHPYNQGFPSHQQHQYLNYQVPTSDQPNLAINTMLRPSSLHNAHPSPEMLGSMGPRSYLSAGSPGLFMTPNHPTVQPGVGYNPQGLSMQGNFDGRMNMKPPQQTMGVNLNDQNMYNTSTGGLAGVYQQQGLQHPTNSMLRQTPASYSQPNRRYSSSSSMSSSTFKYVQRVMAEPNMSKRLERCNTNILDLDLDIKELEEEINEKLVDDEEFCDSAECNEMNRKKASMMKEKRYLESIRRSLEDETVKMKLDDTPQPAGLYQDAWGQGNDGTNANTIYYPPDINKSSHPPPQMGGITNAAPTVSNFSHTNFPTIRPKEPNVGHLPTSTAAVIGTQQQQGLNQGMPVSDACGDFLPVQQMGQMSATATKPRVPVESSIEDRLSNLSTPPAIPPRQEMGPVNILDLNQTVPAPARVPALATIKNWHCEHCTFINDPSSHVCAMCHKTSDNPRLASMSEDDMEANSLDPNQAGDYEGEQLGSSPVSLLQDSGSLSHIRNALDSGHSANVVTEDDEDYMSAKSDSDAEQTKVVSAARIIGSQEQVMREKKLAQAQAQAQFAAVQQQSPELASPTYTHCNTAAYTSSSASTTSSPELTPTSPAHSTNPTLTTNTSSAHPYGVGARPKQITTLRTFDDTASTKSSSSDIFYTPPSVSPTTSTSPNTSVEMRPVTKTTASTGSVGSGGSPGSTSSGNSNISSLDIRDKLARQAELRMIETVQKQGEELARLVKKADQEGFDVEAVQIAMTFCDTRNGGKTPLEWLRANWKKNVSKVANEATGVGANKSENSVGELSEKEAEIAYISCHGNVKESVQHCVEQRTKLFTYLSELGEFPREEILQAMLHCCGDQEKCKNMLLESQLQPFVEHIWMQDEARADDRSFLRSGMGTTARAGSNMCHSISTSVITHDDFQKMIRNKDLDTERRIRLILVEGKLKSWGRAEMVINILDHELQDKGVSLEDVVEAVRDCQSRQSALAFLQQECEICYSKFPMSKIRNLNVCQCRMCEECLVGNFEVVIREKHVRHWVCPLCSQPDLNDPEIGTDYIQFLSLQLQHLISPDLQSLFEDKVRDWHLHKEANFRWCAHCAQGFIAENHHDNRLKMTCPNCHKKTCFHCKKQWEDQHDGLTCEEYNQWKIDNDPSNQSVGLAKHLDENGIDCPQCKMRFALAKGGCMHFKCPECGYEFCSGCNEPYHHKSVCKRYKICGKLGLHCHCPRDCFSYLRDFEVEKLQQLLKQNNVDFNIRPPDDQADPLHCPVMEQKEFGAVKSDERCGKDSQQGHAGLCEMHYKEYLVAIINRNKLDPVSLMALYEIVALANKSDLTVPEQRPNESAEVYKAKLVKLIQKELPLRR